MIDEEQESPTDDWIEHDVLVGGVLDIVAEGLACSVLIWADHLGILNFDMEPERVKEDPDDFEFRFRTSLEHAVKRSKVASFARVVTFDPDHEVLVRSVLPDATVLIAPETDPAYEMLASSASDMVSLNVGSTGVVGVLALAEEYPEAVAKYFAVTAALFAIRPWATGPRVYRLHSLDLGFHNGRITMLHEHVVDPTMLWFRSESDYQKLQVFEKTSEIVVGSLEQRSVERVGAAAIDTIRTHKWALHDDSMVPVWSPHALPSTGRDNSPYTIESLRNVTALLEAFTLFRKELPDLDDTDRFFETRTVDLDNRPVRVTFFGASVGPLRPTAPAREGLAEWKTFETRWRDEFRSRNGPDIRKAVDEYAFAVLNRRPSKADGVALANLLSSLTMFWAIFHRKNRAGRNGIDMLTADTRFVGASAASFALLQSITWRWVEVLNHVGAWLIVREINSGTILSIVAEEFVARGHQGFVGTLLMPTGELLCVQHQWILLPELLSFETLLNEVLVVLKGLGRAVPMPSPDALSVFVSDNIGLFAAVMNRRRAVRPSSDTATPSLAEIVSRLDHVDPVLGASPRALCSTPEGRARVGEWLFAIERSSGRPDQIRQPLDLDSMRLALEIPPLFVLGTELPSGALPSGSG